MWLVLVALVLAAGGAIAFVATREDPKPAPTKRAPVRTAPKPKAGSAGTGAGTAATGSDGIHVGPIDVHL